MSADNYLFIGRWRGRYFAEMRFASADLVDKRFKPVNPAWFDTLSEAINYGMKEVKTTYYEYGLEIQEGLQL